MILKCISLINLALYIICCMKGLQAKDIYDADHFVMRASKAACFGGVGGAIVATILPFLLNSNRRRLRISLRGYNIAILIE